MLFIDAFYILKNEISEICKVWDKASFRADFLNFSKQYDEGCGEEEFRKKVIESIEEAKKDD